MTMADRRLTRRQCRHGLAGDLPCLDSMHIHAIMLYMYLSNCNSVLSATDLHAAMIRRANCMRHLSIEDSVFSDTMPTAVTAAMLGSQCSSLLTLRIGTMETGLADADREITALAMLTWLQELEVRRDPHHGVMKLACGGPLAAGDLSSNGLRPVLTCKLPDMIHQAGPTPEPVVLAPLS